MSDAELRDQLMTLLLAGHETTATGLAWAFDLLFRAPDEAGAPAGRGRGGRPRVPGRRDRGDASHSPGGAVRRAQAERRSRARGLRAARGHGGDGGDLPRPHPPRPLPRALRVSTRAVPRRRARTPTAGSPSGAAPGAASAPPSPSSRCGSCCARCSARPSSARPRIDPSRSCAETSPCRRATAPRRSSSVAVPSLSARRLVPQPLQPLEDLGHVCQIGAGVEDRVQVNARRLLVCDSGAAGFVASCSASRSRKLVPSSQARWADSWTIR